MFQEGVTDFRVFVSVSIDCLTRYNPYENKLLVVTLKVEKDCVNENWLEIKKSSIEGAGFGVFVLRDFSPKEFITVYFGEKIDYTYMYKDLMRLPNISINNGFQEEYWLGHRMNHCSGKMKNVEIRDNYVLCASKKIKAGDELFWDYNRDCFCRVCKKDAFSLTQEISTFDKCSHCQIKKRCFRLCEKCKNFMCPSCYNNFQIKL
jgi:hypothetical protein